MRPTLISAMGCTLITALSPPQGLCDIAGQSDLLFANAKTYVTAPTRLNQVRRDAPAPVTVITADDIKMLGVHRIEDVLRVVPGMVVGERSGNEYTVNFHGGSAFFGKRLQILIDGVSFFQPDYSVIDWGRFPISLNDIARIEVVRSSSAATFGSNAVVGTINVITKSPNLADPVVTLSGFEGNSSQSGGYVRVVKSEADKGVSVSVERFLDDGFDYDENGDDRRDSQAVNRVFVSGDLQNQDWHFTAKAGLTEGNSTVQYIQNEQASFPDIQHFDQFVNLKADFAGFNDHTISLQTSGLFLERQQEWRSCVPTLLFSDELAAVFEANPALSDALIYNRPLPPITDEEQALLSDLQAKVVELGPQAFAPTCGTVNQNYTEKSLMLEIQDIYQYSDSLRHVLAVGVKSDHGVSETYMNGARDNRTEYALANLEYSNFWVTSNVGGYAERDDFNATTFSSRASLNLKVHPRATLRFAIAHSERSPDNWEQTVDWSYRVRDLDPLYEGQAMRPYYRSARSPGKLRSEVMFERDVGIFFVAPEIALNLDVNFFQNTMTHLISESNQFIDFHPTNNSKAELQGVDIELGSRIIDDVRVGAGYSYQDLDASNPYEETLAPQHSGYFYSTWRATHRSTLTYALYAYDNAAGSSYLRSDFIFSQMWKFGRTQLDNALAFRHYQNTHQRYFLDFGVYEDNFREHISEMEFSLSLRF